MKVFDVLYEAEHSSGDKQKKLQALKAKLAQAREELSELPQSPGSQEGYDALDDARYKVKDLEAEIAKLSESAATDPQAAYGEVLTKVNASMKALHAAMADHRRKFMEDPRNWGYVGDMQELAKKLDEMVAFFNHGAEV